MADNDAVDQLVDHLKRCREVDSAIVADGNADDLVLQMLAEGWAYSGVEYVSGKRVRYLVAPPGWVPPRG